MLDDKINQMINNVRKVVPYNKLYGKLSEKTEFIDIPFLEDCHISGIEFESLNKNQKNVCAYFTSGTTSDPKAVYHNNNEANYLIDYLKWFCKMEGISGRERVAVLMGQSFWGAGYFTVQGHIKSGNMVMPVDSGLSKEKIGELIRIFQPTVISSTPSFLLGLKDALKGVNVKIIETTGEMMDKKMRKNIENIYNAEVYDAYGLTEGLIGTECLCHDGYHFQPNKVYLEIIKSDTGEILGDEKWGELVMTVLCNSIMPIIRYKTKDLCKISRTKCKCGNKYPRIWIRGRKEKSIPLYEGAKVALKDVEGVMFEVYGKSAEFTINVKTNKNRSTMRINIKDCNIKRKKLAIEKISAVNYETLYLTETGKLQIIFKD